MVTSLTPSLMPSLRVGSQTIQFDQVLPLLNRYRLMPQVLRGLIIDEAIAPFSCDEAEQEAAMVKLCQQHQLTTPEAQAIWLQKQGMSLEEMQELVLRSVRLEKFKAETWGNKINSYFLERKASFDRVIYSLIRTKDLGLAQELYFRILEDEQSFAEVAQQYSQGTEAASGGLIGPVPLSQPHPIISKLLTLSQPGQICAPQAVTGWFVLVRLEKFFPAQLDAAMRQQLLDELFENWIQSQIQSQNG